MNTQDLLFTNTFESTDVITASNLESSRKNYGRFREYIGSRQLESNEYIKNDNKESDGFNLNKTRQEPWPPNLKKNHYPLFDEYTNDIVSSRYRKERLTKISINSNDRNKTQYLYPNNFQIPFNKTYTNVQEIRITDICFPNFYAPVNNYNNALSWQYGSKSLIISELVDANIIPVPIQSQVILYSSLYLSASDIPSSGSNQLVYQTFIPEGFYNTKTLEKQIFDSCAQIVHGCSYLNYLELEKKRNSPINNDPEPWVYAFEDPYYSNKEGINTPTLMRFSINPTRNTVFAVNRMEEVEVVAIQTFDSMTEAADLPTEDVFYPYISSTTSTFDNKYIYVTVKKQKYSTSNWWTVNECAFPLVFTHLTGDVGGIPGDYLNYTEFYDLQIYTNNGYTESQLNSTSTYKLYDTIEFTDINGRKHQYLRFALKFSTGNINGRRDVPNGGWIVRPTTTSTNIYNPSLAQSLLNGQVSNGYYMQNFENKTSPLLGRSLLMRFIFDLNNGNFIDFEFDTENVKKRSILEILAWPIPNDSTQTAVLSDKPTFSFVHSNISGVEVQKNIDILKQNAITFIYRSPVNRLNLQLYNGEYYFVSNNFLFIKISPTTQPVTYTNMQIAIDNQNLQLNQNYVTDPYFQTTIGGDYTCLPSQTIRTEGAKTKDYSNIFGKIIISSIPNNIEPNLFVNSNFAKLYNKPIDELQGIEIQILDPNMMVYPLGRDFSFTIEIIEVIELLKETLIDTKRDTVVTQGYRNY